MGWRVRDEAGGHLAVVLCDEMRDVLYECELQVITDIGDEAPVQNAELPRRGTEQVARVGVAVKHL